MPVLAGVDHHLLLTTAISAPRSSTRKAAAIRVLFQHLFWFLRHPEVYSLSCRGFGMVSQSWRPSRRNRCSAIWHGLCHLVALASASWLAASPVHGRMSTTVQAYLRRCHMVIAVPTGVRSSRGLRPVGRLDRFKTPMLWAIGFIFRHHRRRTGVVLANAGVDRSLQDTYYVVAHFPLRALPRRGLHHLCRLVLLVPEEERACPRPRLNDPIDGDVVPAAKASG